MASVRRQIEIDRSADEVWALVGDPASIAGWFPGIVECQMDGTTRVITTAAGLAIPEEILTVDDIQRRFQYRVSSPIVRHHLGTIDVFALDDGHTLVSYATDCEPDPMALIIGGATGAALAEIRRQVLETASAPERGAP
jgi:hypothetical protein